jgi:mxaJ protein
VKSGNDLFALPADVRDRLRIGFYDKSPAVAWLVKHGIDKDSQLKAFPMMSPDPDVYPGQIIDKDLAHGTIDAAVVWGPIAGYFAKRVHEPQLVVIPLRSEPGIKFDYEIAMGVRRGEGEWKATVEKLIAENQAAITAILRDYQVPLLDAQGELMN